MAIDGYSFGRKQIVFPQVNQSRVAGLHQFGTREESKQPLLLVTRMVVKSIDVCKLQWYPTNHMVMKRGSGQRNGTAKDPSEAGASWENHPEVWLRRGPAMRIWLAQGGTVNLATLTGWGRYQPPQNWFCEHFQLFQFLTLPSSEIWTSLTMRTKDASTSDGFDYNGHMLGIGGPHLNMMKSISVDDIWLPRISINAQGSNFLLPVSALWQLPVCTGGLVRHFSIQFTAHSVILRWEVQIWI